MKPSFPARIRKAALPLAIAAAMLGAMATAGAQTEAPAAGHSSPDAEAAFRQLFADAEQRLLNAGPRLNAVRRDVIGELVAFAGRYEGSVAAAAAMQNAGRLAEVLGAFDEAETQYRNGLLHRPPEPLHSELAFAVPGVIARPGREIRDFTARTLEGETVSPESLKGKVYLLDFWATWCGPCIAELPHLRRTYQARNAEGFEIVSISVDSSKDDLTDFLSKNEMPWIHVYDEDRPADARLGDRFGVYGIPHTILVGKDGRIMGGGYRGTALDEAVSRALEQ